jgi:hypothetical protein
MAGKGHGQYRDYSRPIDRSTGESGYQAELPAQRLQGFQPLAGDGAASICYKEDMHSSILTAKCKENIIVKKLDGGEISQSVCGLESWFDFVNVVKSFRYI